MQVLNTHTRTCLGEFVIKLTCCDRAVRVHVAHASAARMHLLFASVLKGHGDRTAAPHSLRP